MKDSLEEMFLQQKEFMDLLSQERNFPKSPFDLTSKKGQRDIKELVHCCMEEMYEACVLLKNSKHHRATEVKEFDREMYLEELSDAMHYLIEIVIASGFSMSEFKKVFLEKGEKNKNRIKLGY